MAELSLTQDVVPIVERLPKDLIDPEAKERLIRYTEHVERAFRLDERGRVVADVQRLRDLAANGDFFRPLSTKALHEVLSETEERELVDEKGEMRPLTKAELEQVPRELTVESIDRFIADIDPDIARRLKGLKIPVIGDQPAPADFPPEDGIPPEEVPEKLDAFKKCLKDNLDLFALAIVLVAIGALMAVIGVFVPPVGTVAVWIIVAFGSVIASYVIGCLVAAGFLSQD